MTSLEKITLNLNKEKWRSVQVLLGLATYLISTNSAQALTCVDFSVTPISFGVYSSSSGSNLTTSGGITINKFFDCLNPLQLIPTNFTIKLSTGSSGTYSSRKMTNLLNASQLEYNLYSSSSVGSSVWGDGSGGSSLVNQTGSSNINIPIYGVVSAGQNAAIGNYSDTITATIEFN